MATEDQGIMSLPQAGAETPAPQMSMDEAYDAVQGGLQDVSPEVAGDVQGAISQITPMLDQLSDEELDSFLELLQYLIEHPEEYSKIVSDLVAQGQMEEGMLPEEYDPELLSALAMVFFTARRQRQAGNEREMAAQMPQPPVGMARGGIAEAARMVASKGRGGDTMLAHITPGEAALLKRRGGSGTINPATGLPEFFLNKIFKAVTNVFKSVVNAVKKVVKSPIGKILATVALATFLGPGAFGIQGLGLGASIGTAGVSALSSGIVTAIGGGSMKDVLRSAATAYLGAPGGPVSTYIGNAGAALGVTNAAGQAAINAGLTGVGVGVLTGQKLGDAVKSGLIAGAVQGGMTGFKEGFGAQATPPTSPRVPMPLGGGTPGGAPVPGAAPAPGQIDPALLYGEGAGSGSASAARPALDQIYEGYDPAQSAAVKGAARYMPASTTGAVPGTAPVAGAPAVGGAPTPPPGVMDSMGRIGGGVTDMLRGDFAKGFEGFKSGAGDLFAPKSYTPAELRTTPEYQSAIDAKGATDASALAQAEKIYNPSTIRSYAPMVAAGLGIAGLSGGFSPKEPPPSELAQRLRGTPGEDLIKADPNKYVVQNLPGVKYDERGNIVGSQPWQPSVTMEDVRVPTIPRIPTYTLPPIGAAPPMQMFQPYNTANMYTNLMAPVSRAQGGVASLAQGGYPRRTGQISGPGTETSDSIPAMLSDGEFVMTAKAVRAAGKGDRRAGAKKMYALMHQLERNASRG